MDWSDQQKHAVRFCEMPEEQGETMLPIWGYGKMPLCTLDKAVEPLLSVVPEVRHMVWIAKLNCENSPNNLHRDESASIMVYSMEWQPRENSFYIILNQTLRAGNRALLKPWFLYLKLFITALSKIPGERRYLYRGIKKDVSVEYPPGKTFVWWGFSSCTSSINVLENETFLGKTGARTLFTIDCHSGKDIRQHSMFKTEEEVLLLAARQFQVLSCMNAGHDLNIIQIREIDPSPPLLEPLPISHKSKPVKHLPLSSLNKLPIYAPYRNDRLEQTIRECPSPKVILNGQQVTDQDMEIVTKQAILHKQCVILYLMSNEVTECGARILADALCHNTDLEELNLSHNRISDSGVHYLASAISTSALQRLDLAENDISDVGANCLGEMLATNTKLLQLSLSENRIGNHGMKLFTNALIGSNTRLEVLDLSANTDISDESIDSIVDMMEHNRSLRKLDVRHNNLSKDGEKRLRAAAKRRKGFELWLSHCI